MALNFSTTLNNTARQEIPLTALDGMRVLDAAGIEVSPWVFLSFTPNYATKSRDIKDVSDTIHLK